MDVIPGIDLMDGKCVCALHNPFAVDRPASHDPSEVAESWARQGATRLYVADLDGARMGSPKNLKAVAKLVESGVPIDFGGGIRTLDTAKRVLDSGVDRIVIGTTAALEDRLAREILAEVGDRTVVSLASLNGYVAVRDWQARTDEKAEDFVLRMKGLGARRVVFTDVSRKGMRGGANVVQLRRMALSIDIPIIASGGISSLEDVRQLKELEPLGLEGMIVVTALYSGAMRLADAIEIAEAPIQ